MAEEVIAAVEKQPEGATIEQVETALKVPRRTLQRRLAELVSAGRLRAIGRAKQRRYQFVAVTEVRPEELTVSRAGQQVRELVRRPLIHRMPVGYIATLLDSYRPNLDFYLDAPTRARLHERGRAPGVDRPAGTYARQILSRLLVDLCMRRPPRNGGLPRLPRNASIHARPDSLFLSRGVTLGREHRGQLDIQWNPGTCSRKSRASSERSCGTATRGARSPINRGRRGRSSR